MPRNSAEIAQQVKELLSSQLAVLKSCSLQTLSAVELQLYQRRDGQIQQLLREFHSVAPASSP